MPLDTLVVHVHYTAQAARSDDANLRRRGMTIVLHEQVRTRFVWENDVNNEAPHVVRREPGNPMWMVIARS
jgi:hypothetical protein